GSPARPARAPGPRACQLAPRPLAAGAPPADAARRTARHQGEGDDIAGARRTGGDEAVHAQTRAADDRGVSADGHPALDDGRKEFVFSADLGAGGLDVSEHATRAAKDIVRQLHSLVDADIVLNLAAVADAHVGSDHDILSDRAIAADDAAPDDVGKMPDAGVLADLATVIDDSRFVRQIGQGLTMRKGRPRTDRALRAARLHRALCGVENTQHVETLAPVGPNRGMIGDPVQEVAAFLGQRFAPD